MTRPYLVVRAGIEPSIMHEFLRWYEREHLPHVMEIPGIVRAFRSNCHRRGINWTALNELADDAAVQPPSPAARPTAPGANGNAGSPTSAS